jgi:ADP-ribose pyrophosphatase
VERSNCRGIVVVLALTKDQKVILVEQYRIPVKKNVIEFPAGLASDTKMYQGESLKNAAKRELLEETGFLAKRMTLCAEGPASSASSSDILTIFKAEGLEKVAKGGGDETENILVHEVPVAKIRTWLKSKEKKGCLVDPRVYAGLFLLTHP